MPVGINSNSNRSIVKNITVGIPEKRVTGGFDINTIAGVNTDAKTHGDLLVYDSNTSKYVTATIVTGDGITFTWQDSDSSGNATFLLTLDSSEIDRDVRALISVSDAGGDGSLAYNSTTGVITYTGPSASEVRAHLSAGTNLSFSSGAFSLDSSQHVKVSKITTSSDIVAGGNVEIGANSFVGTEIEVKKIAAKDSDDIYSSANIHVNGQIQADSATFNRLRTRVYSFPTADGTQSGQAIVTDGSGNLSFAFAGSEGIVVSAMKDLADVDNDLQTKRHPDHFLLWDSSYTTHVGTGQYVSTVFGTEVHSRFASSTDLTFDSSTGRFTITNTGVDSGVYGSSSVIPIITVSPQGQIDSIGTATAYTTSSFNTDLASKNTDNLSEGSTNLYFTNTRADARVTALVDSAYVQLRQSASGGGGTDSSTVSAIITADVNASFINALTIGADSFGGQAPSFYRNAGNLNAGTVDSARLPVIASANTADSASNAALAVRAGIATTTTGNAATATALETARKIGGVTPNSVALSTDTTGNYVAAGATSGSGISGSVSSEGGTFTVTSNATNNNTNSTLVFRDGSGNFAAGTITAALSGNASTADSATTAKDAVNALQLANQAASHYLDYANFSNTPTIPTLYGSFVDSTEARKAVSATDAGGDGSFAYNNSTGVFTYTGPSASEARAHFSAGTGVTLSSGEISIGQAVGTSDNVTFGNVVTSNLTVNGTTTSVNSITYTVNDPLIHLADSNETSDALDIGFLGHYFRDGQRRHTGLFRDASNQEYYLYHNLVDSAFDSSVPPNVINRGGTDFTQAMLNANITGAVTGNASTATALATGRNFSITGDVTAGAVSFDGSGNVALTAAIASDVIVNADIKSDAAIADTKLATISTSGKVANSATTATNANTNSAIVARDGSGNFSAGTITAALSGNASTADSAAAAALAVRAGIATTAAAADSAAAAALAVRAGIATLAAEATALETARTIGGVSFDGTANINLPGVNTAGNQNTSGSAATLTTARTIGGVSFDGSGNINLPGVNQAGNQNTSGNAATADSATNAALAVRAGIATTAASADSAAAAALAVRAGIATLAAQATALETARNIGGVSFDGTGNINLPGVNTAGNQNTSGTAAIATTVTVTDNESTNEDNVILFGAGAAGSGNIGVEADGTMTYNPSTGKITATGFIGALTGDASGNAATATALETARNIGGVSFDGTANINLPGVNTSGNQNTSGTAAIATAVTVADESTDTTCFPLFATAASGDLEPKSGSNLTFNSSNGTLGATVFSGSGASLTSITSSNFTSAVTLLIKNSAGSTLKTIVGSAT